MSYEIREKLIPYLGKRVKVRGVLGKWGEWIRNHRDVGRMGIQSPEIDHEVVADYVWVTDVPHWKHLKGKEGNQVEFEAVVSKYRQRDGKVNYCLTNSSEPSFLHQPPALAIPDVSMDDELMMPDEPEMEEPISEAVVMQVPVSRDAIQDWRLARTFAKACGTSAKALEILGKMPDMPVALLQEYLAVLSEE